MEVTRHWASLVLIAHPASFPVIPCFFCYLFVCLFCFVLFFSFWLCGAACGILVLRPGLEPGPSAVKVQSPNRWTAKEFLFNSLDVD